MRPSRRFAQVLRSILVLLLVAVAVGPVAAAKPAHKAASAADSLHLDPAVRAGVLPNGLHYFIRTNQRPAARASLRLAVNAGSNLERDDQQGLAHFDEHMNFNGSTHFKADELVAYLQSIGLRFGADANAYTSFDETVYMLTVPTDRDTLLDRGLVALSDFAGRALLSQAEIDKERGVVLEEWRLGRGAQDRILRKQLPVLLRGSRYEERLPIGKPEIIEHAPPARLRDYYRTWYTPDRMAVIAVGDFDPARMDSLIRAHFADLPGPRAVRTTPRYEVPPHRETRISIATDKEAISSQVSIAHKRARHAEATVQDFRRSLLESLFSSMLNARLDEIAHRKDAPFLWAQGYSSPWVRTLEAYSLSAGVVDGSIDKGFAALLSEVARVRQHGFLASELERAKRDLAAENERAYAERNKTESDTFAGELVSYYLAGDVPPGIEAAHALTGALLPGIGLDEMNALAGALLRDQDRVVLASGPEKAGVAAPSEAALRAVLARTAAESTVAWQDTTAGKSLMRQIPAPGTVRERRTVDEIGATVLTLSNGAEVWLKPTDFKADEIQFQSYARGGLSVADSAFYISAWLGGPVVNDAGLGGYKAADLQKLLAGHIVEVTPYFNDYTHGVSGATRPADLETALQLVHLTFTQPTEDPDAFAALRKRFDTFLADRANSPEQVFQDTVTAVNTGNFYMDRFPTVAEVDAAQLGPVLDFYRQRFANAADFTFFFTGAFAVDSIVPLIERYIGSLPSRGVRDAAWAPRGPRFPDGIRAVQVRKGLEPKSSTRITFLTHADIEELDLHRARAAASILTDHLRQRLREALGGTYGASVSFGTRNPLPGYATMTVEFGCAPENVEKMVAATIDEVKTLRDQGPSAADVQKDQEIERRELETNQRRNDYWTASMQTVHMLGWDLRRIAKRRERIDLLTTENLRESFRKYFPLDRYTVVTLLPQPGAGTTPGTKGK